MSVQWLSRIVLIGAGFLSQVAVAQANVPISFGKNVISPKAGVICDVESGYCVGSEGISVNLTRQFMGAKAAASLTEWMQDRDPQGDALTKFVLSNGISCNVIAKNCTTSRYSKQPDTRANQVLFTN